MRHLFIFVSVLFLALSMAGYATADDTARNKAERIHDTRETQKDRKAAVDDREDRIEITVLQQQYENAVKKTNTTEMARVEGDVMHYLQMETKEAGIEITQAERERRRSRREQRTNRREIRENRREGAGPGKKLRERHNRRDDRRDLRDNREDAQEQIDHREQLTCIYYEWESLMEKTDETSVARKKVLLNDLVTLSQAEIADNQDELKEEHRERREDRRETRENRREN